MTSNNALQRTVEHRGPRLAAASAAWPAAELGRQTAVKSRAVLAFVVSGVLGAAVWALSVPVTGMSEPWDAEGPYYVVALSIAGAIAGGIVPKHLGAHYAGAVLGQAAYELVFLKFGALFVLGLAFLAGYSIIFLATAAIAASLRGGKSNEATAV